MSKKIGIIVGSIRPESISSDIGRAMANLFPADFEVSEISIKDLPMYVDDSADYSYESYDLFRAAVHEQDAIIFITPEHNRSIPASLKNALDVASRPYGQAAWSGKTALIVSHSPGLLSGFGANAHLRQILAVLNVDVIAQPEVYLAQSHTIVDKEGNFLNEGTQSFVQQAVDTLVSKI